MFFVRSLKLVLASSFLTALVASAATSGDQCLSFYEASVSDIIFRIDSIQRLQTSKTQWLALPLSDRGTQKLVETLIGLSPAKKAKLIQSVSSKRFRDSGLKNIVLLALHDEGAWFAYLEKAMKGPLLDDSLVNSLIPVIRSMPEDLKAKVISKVTSNYSTLSKINHTNFPRRRNLRLAPKRSVDAVLLHLIKPDLWLKKDLEETQDPVQSYANYLNFLKTDIFPGSDRGNYSTDVIMTVAETIQAKLRTLTAQFDNPSITITGSFPNGRAKLAETDLDCQVSNQGLIEYFPELSALINTKMASRFSFPSQFQVDSMWETTTPHFAAQINPIFLKITPTHIQIEVYSAVQPLHKDSVLLPQNYAAPDVYVLKHQPLSPGNKAESVASTHRKVVPSVLAGPTEVAKKLEQYQERDWIEFVRAVAKGTEDTEAIRTTLVPIISRMPVDLKSRVLREIQVNYTKTKERKWFPTNWFSKKSSATLTAKQALDALVSQMASAKAFIENEVIHGQYVEIAYEKYLSNLYAHVYNNSGMGRYRSFDVTAASLAIRQFIKSTPEIPQGTEILLVGSFPNGRAPNGRVPIELIIPDGLRDLDLKTITAGISQQLKNIAFDQKFEVIILSQNTTATKIALVDPIQIKISSAAVDLIVYDPIRAMDRDTVLLPHNYAPAKVFPLFGPKLKGN